MKVNAYVAVMGKLITFKLHALKFIVNLETLSTSFDISTVEFQKLPYSLLTNISALIPV